MTKQEVDFEKMQGDIRNFTSAAKYALLALERGKDTLADARETARIYGAVAMIPTALRSLHIGLSDPKLLRDIHQDTEKEILSQLVCRLVEAHLDLYEIATQKCQGDAIDILSDRIRTPALAILQSGYICLAFLKQEKKASLPDLERLVRKGETSLARKDMHVRDAIDLLKEALEERNMPGSQKPGRQSKKGVSGKIRIS